MPSAISSCGTVEITPMTKVLPSAFQKKSSPSSRVKLRSPAHSMSVGAVSSTRCSAAHPV
ncbi:hypothetical protein SRIMM317S_06667 [Streptomyces rimosus subsp. rimosus]